MFPQFKFIFLFSHSNGHDRMQPNGLSLTKIKMRHGGKQPFMHSSLITPDLLGPFHTPKSQLQPGMYQLMTYTDSDTGPCYYTPTQIDKFCNDTVTGTCRERDLSIEEMTTHLRD